LAVETTKATLATVVYHFAPPVSLPTAPQRPLLRRSTLPSPLHVSQTASLRSATRTNPTDDSTRSLQLTTALYDTYTSVLTTSATLIKTLDKADWYDRLVILAAMTLFLAIVGWIIKRRVLDRMVGGVLGVGWWWVKGSGRLIKRGLGAGPTASLNSAISPVVGMAKGVDSPAGSISTAVETVTAVMETVAETATAKAKAGSMGEL
jgi:hypothetical protein